MNQINEVHAIYRDNGKSYEDNDYSIMNDQVYLNIDNAKAALVILQNKRFVAPTKDKYETTFTENARCWISYEKYIEMSEREYHFTECNATYSLVTLPIQH